VATEEELHEEISTVGEQIGRLVQRHAELRALCTGDPLIANPYVRGWAVAYEYTSHQLEIAEQSGRGVIIPDGQMISASLGLGVHLQDRFT